MLYLSPQHKCKIAILFLHLIRKQSKANFIKKYFAFVRLDINKISHTIKLKICLEQLN